MPTKAELEERLKSAEWRIRRLQEKVASLEAKVDAYEKIIGFTNTAMASSQVISEPAAALVRSTLNFRRSSQ